MKTKFFAITAAMIAIAALVFVIGCSDDTTTSGKQNSLADDFINDVVESTYASIEPETVDLEYAIDSGAESPNVVVNANLVEGDGPLVLDMIAKDGFIYALTLDGIVVHRLSDGSNVLIPTENTVSAMIDLGDKILVGGDNLYTLDGDVLSCEDYDLDLDGQITTLARRGMDLLVGTDKALYQLNSEGIRQLAADVNVSAIAPDDFGIWVGTTGDGLYFWDGDSFRKRFLQRDSTLFDNVTALTYNHNHLYLGTDRGMFIFDGGRWQQYGLADGLPSEIITTINAGDWVVKVGTANGAVTFFNNEFKLMPRFEGLAVREFIRYDNKLLAATTNAGLVMKSGGILTPLYNGAANTPAMALEETW